MRTCSGRDDPGGQGDRPGMQSRGGRGGVSPLEGFSRGCCRWVVKESRVFLRDPVGEGRGGFSGSEAEEVSLRLREKSAVPIELLVAERGCLEASAGVLQEQWASIAPGGDGER